MKNIETKMEIIEVPSEWAEAARVEADSFQAADSSSMSFFRACRNAIANAPIPADQAKALRHWVDANIKVNATASRLKKVIKMALDAIELHIGDVVDGDKLHIALRLEVIHFYNLEAVIRLKKRMAAELKKEPKDREVGGNAIKSAQRTISELVEISDPTEYNNRLREEIKEIKKEWKEEGEDKEVQKKVASFEAWLKSLPPKEAGRVLSRLNKELSASRAAVEQEGKEEIA